MPHDPNPIWDELCTVLGLKPVTKSENARIGRIVRDLKAKDAEPGDIARVVAAHRKAWPSISLVTPESIHKHWDQLLAVANSTGTPSGGRNWART